MKVVITACFGGFGLSTEAKKLYAKKKGFEVFFYNWSKFKTKDGTDEYVNVQEETNITTYTLKKFIGDKVDKLPQDSSLWHHDSDIARNDPILIEVVEELGDKANTRYSELKIVEIPDGIEWEIDEYDGCEKVVEKHRSWQ